MKLFFALVFSLDADEYANSKGAGRFSSIFRIAPPGDESPE